MALTVLTLLGALLCVSGCGHSAADQEKAEAARWKAGGPSKSYGDMINAKRAAAPAGGAGAHAKAQ